ncbi:MAG: hypothetical protein A2173_07220 [Planctomycetes bacterium RBG_13_44_8b]|nr:MAG: hypothetical protein A2173_07220 [Planctomycetes bacterium RBG_13_44_8b]
MPTIIIEGLNTILLALTPVQRWQALKGFETDISPQRWFTLICVIALMILALMLLWVSYKRISEERKISEQMFFDCTDRLGLNEHECRILLKVVKKSGIKQKDAIFTMEDAFLRGATKIIDESIAIQPNSPESAYKKIEENERLISDLAFLREKLGFKPYSTTSLKTKPKNMSSRQIPVGKELHITPHKIPRSTGVDCKVIQNNNVELTLKLETPVQSLPGELWHVRFYATSSVWEFDSSVVCCDGDVLVLHHSNNIRFINRRRFMRTQVNQSAFVARFPFEKIYNSEQNSNDSRTDQKAEQKPVKGSIDSWAPPEFVPAVVTELAGVGLCLDVPFEVELGERLIIVFKLENDDHDSSSQEADNISTPKIIQDICEVRHKKATKNGLSIGVELIGLNDSDVNELVRFTNSTLAKVRNKTAAIQPVEEESNTVQNLTNNDDNQQDKEKDAVVQEAAQGI